MTEDATTLETADIAAIMKALPHRYPFLMVDREPQFQGHFPGEPVVPGVLLIEGMAQTAGVLCVMSREAKARPKRVYFITIDKAKFRKPVGPGDTVEYHMTKINRRKTMWWFRGEAKVHGDIVAEAEVGAMLVDA